MTFLAFWLFCSGIGYGRLQFNTGVRYMSTAIPLLFPLAAAVLLRLPRVAAFLVVAPTVTISWCLAMYRYVEQPLGIFDPVVRTLVGGFQIPALTTLSRMEAYESLAPAGTSPLPAFVLVGVCLWWIWRQPDARAHDQSSTT
jgi:hypothetical protein